MKVSIDDDRGRGEVIMADVPAEFEAQVLLAVSACPEKAITIS